MYPLDHEPFTSRPPQTPIRCLTIAGSDSGGGAGIQTDLKTFAAHGTFGMSAITALTAQNTAGVQGVLAIEPDFVDQQIRSVVEDIGVDGVKTGMLPNAEMMHVVAEWFRHPAFAGPRVVDPVMVATSGDPLVADNAISTMRDVLLPRATIITPNIPEAALLLGREFDPNDREQMQKAATDLLEFTTAVYLKGGHGITDICFDCLVSRGSEVRWFESLRLETRNTHGTGCTLASAICAGLAKGQDIDVACQSAKNFLFQALNRGKTCRLGAGHGPALIADLATWPA